MAQRMNFARHVSRTEESSIDTPGKQKKIADLENRFWKSAEFGKSK